MVLTGNKVRRLLRKEEEDFGRARAHNLARLQSRLERICAKYDHPFEESDVIDLESLDIVVDNGFLRRSQDAIFGEGFKKKFLHTLYQDFFHVEETTCDGDVREDVLHTASSAAQPPSPATEISDTDGGAETVLREEQNVESQPSFADDSAPFGEVPRTQKTQEVDSEEAHDTFDRHDFDSRNSDGEEAGPFPESLKCFIRNHVCSPSNVVPTPVSLSTASSCSPSTLLLPRCLESPGRSTSVPLGVRFFGNP